jgi:hypothetical protein
VGQHRHGNMGYASLLDAGAAGDPLIIRFEKRGKSRIVQYRWRHALAPASDRSVFHRG